MQFEPFDYMVWAKRHQGSVRFDLLARAWERAAANREQMARFLGDLPGLACAPPSHLAAPTLVERMRVECDTLAVPGDFFDAPGWIRLVYGAAPELVAEGLSHFRRILASASPV